MTLLPQSQWEFVRRKPSGAWLSGRGSSDGERVELPHSWNRSDTFQEGVSYYRGWGGYRHSFHLDSPRPHLRLRAGGFYGAGDVWLNGKKLADINGQFIGIDLALPELPAGDHQLGIRLHNTYRRHMLPGIDEPDFVLHGGLAGGLRIEAVPLLVDQLLIHSQYGQTHLQLLGPAGPPPDLPVEIDFLGETRSWTGSPLVYDRLAPPWHVDQPTLSPITVRCGSWQHRWTWARRDAEFRPDAGFFLNGQRLELCGVNRHENIPGLGNALPDDMQRDEARQIRDAGFNLVRLSHYPQSPAFLDACDELGLLVYAELATWKRVRTGRWLKNAKQQMRRMIQRDGHRPSVICWGLANEAQHHKAFAELIDVVKATDLPTPRPTIYAENHLYRGHRHKTLDQVDVLGVNYELDALEEARDASRNQALLISEMSNQPDAKRGTLDEELLQVEQLERDWAALRDTPFVAGWCIWCWADYATLRKRRYLRYSGLVDAMRLPKPALARIRARLDRRRPFVDAFGNWGKDGPAERQIWVASNRGPVTLRLGDHEQTLPRSEWQQIQITWQDRPLVVEIDGAQCVLQPFAEATAIRVHWSRPWLEIRIVDQQGRTSLSTDTEAVIEIASGLTPRYWNPEQQVQIHGGIGRLPFESSQDEQTISGRVIVENGKFFEDFCFPER